MSEDVRRAFAQRVAQSLHFASLALGRANVGGVAGARESVDSALRHLATAYAAFVGEVLAVGGRHPFGDRQALNPWLQQLPASDAPEIARLRIEGEQGWLRDMLQAWERLGVVEIRRPPKAHETSIDVIPLKVLPEQIEVDVVDGWRRALVALVDELREGLAEW